MQRVLRPGKPLVVIDYAHTPDALTKALEAARRHVGGRVICVFGCGGDRDRGKRPLMARAVEGAADLAWVTNDNPRSEVPLNIANDVLGGFTGKIQVNVELDRQRAIELAIAAATPNDLVLVAGKGHEAYQEIGGQRLPHSDLAAVEAVLR
jgi:UDP-N-acetylmuramoyl-L-alanyl-D-glutamate--2,6-diaminopimelate ligase